MGIVERFRDYILANDLFSRTDKLLLAVSGGVDSVVLCELCRQAGFSFGIAHCNFQLRGEDSARDEKFVGDLAEKYKVNFHVIRFDTRQTSQEKKISTQEAARELRYAWFEEIREKSGYHYILTAHHADDNTETLLMNFFRGTGIRGLGGIEPKHDFIVRPLLFARRAELEHFMEANQLPFVADYTNQQDDYTRNYFRNQVIPLIERSYPGVKENLISNIERFREAAQLYQQAIAQHKMKLLEHRGNETHIPVLKLKKLNPLSTILYEILKEYGFTPHQLPDVVDLLDSESGKYVRSPSHRIVRNRGWLIIAPNEPEKTAIIIIEEAGTWPFVLGALQVQFTTKAPSPLPAANSMACLDAAEIKFPLILRKWKQGDYFYPLGMRKKKKLARFFIDQKLARTEKEKVWVVEMEKKIIWVVNHRIDDRFRLTPDTKSILTLKFSSQIE